MRLEKSFVVAIALASLLWAADPAVGTWKIDLNLSRVRDPATWKSSIMLVESEGKASRRITITDVATDGQTKTLEDLEITDGKEMPDKLNPGRTILHERVDDWTTRTTWKEAGKPVKLIVSSVSQDGSKMTEYLIGRDENGAFYQEKRVFHRQ